MANYIKTPEKSHAKTCIFVSRNKCTGQIHSICIYILFFFLFFSRTFIAQTEPSNLQFLSSVVEYPYRKFMSHSVIINLADSFSHDADILSVCKNPFVLWACKFKLFQLFMLYLCCAHTITPIRINHGIISGKI